MKTTTHYPDFEVTELTNEDAAELLSGDLELVETEEDRVKKALAPRHLHVVPIADQMRMAREANTAYAEACARRESDRALELQIQWAVRS